MGWQEIYGRLLSELYREWRSSPIRTSDIEDRLGISEGYFGKLCRGEYNFKLSLFFRAIEVLGLDPRAFLSRALELRPEPEDYLRQLEEPDDGDRALPRMARATSELEVAEPPPALPRATATAEDVAAVAACSRKDQLRRLSVIGKYRNHAFTRAFLEHLDSLRYDDAELAARLATRVAVQLIPALPGPQEGRLSLQCLALGVFASARRLKGEFATAARALRLALELSRRAGLREDRGNLLLRASYVLKYFGHFHRAQGFLEEALAIFFQLGAPADMGRVMVVHGMMSCYLGEFEAAVLDLEQALEYLAGSETRLSRYHLSAYQHTAFAYEQLDRLGEAHECLERGARAFPPQHAVDAAMLQWQRGRLAARHGEYERADKLMRRAGAVIADKAFPGSEALLALDRIGVFLAQGRGQEAADLAIGVAPLLFRFKDNRIAEAAILQLIHAATEGRLHEGVVADVRRKLEGERTPEEVRSRGVSHRVR